MPREYNFTKPLTTENENWPLDPFKKERKPSDHEITFEQRHELRSQIPIESNASGHYLLVIPVQKRFDKPEAMSNLNEFANDSYSWLEENVSGAFSWEEGPFGYYKSTMSLVGDTYRINEDSTVGGTIFCIRVTFIDERDALRFSDRWPEFDRWLELDNMGPMPYAKKYRWNRKMWDIYANGIDLSEAQKRALPASPQQNFLAPEMDA